MFLPKSVSFQERNNTISVFANGGRDFLNPLELLEDESILARIGINNVAICKNKFLPRVLILNDQFFIKDLWIKKNSVRKVMTRKSL